MYIHVGTLRFTHTHLHISLIFSGPQVQKLQAILKPMMLRRLKEDVEKNLAPKQETIIEVSAHSVCKLYCITVFNCVRRTD